MQRIRDARLRRLLKECLLALGCRGPRPALTNLLVLVALSVLGWIALWLAAAVTLRLLA